MLFLTTVSPFLPDKQIPGDLQHCRPFLVCGKQVGVMQARVIEAACRYPDVFHMDSSGMMSLHPSLTTYEERSARINQVLTQWREERLFVTLKGWRNEVDAVSHQTIRN